jgi:hypothetical protein
MYSKNRKYIEDLKKKIETMQARYEPKWWSEWLASNRPVSENTVNESGVKNDAAGETSSPPPPKNSDKVD